MTRPLLFFYLRRIRVAPLVAALLVALNGSGLTAHAQNTECFSRYWVTLTDKDGVKFNAASYFSSAARARRVRQHLPAWEMSDLPLRADYSAKVKAGVDTVLFASRWFNAISCRATATQAQALSSLSGVKKVELWPYCKFQVAGNSQSPPTPKPSPHTIAPNDYFLARRQVVHLDGPAWQKAGMNGQGLKIAVFDVGFNQLDEHPAFRQLIQEKRIIATHDFLKNRDEVFHGGSHGTEVMGCLAGRLPDTGEGQVGPALGLAPAAEYLLARTEQLRRESFGEEEAWLAAAEWADRLGADIINSSLAYTEQRYFPEQMNGHRSLIARAANLAARKGMLVVSAAGNDGDNDWVRIGTPADADSVLAVGGLDPETGLHVDFSSFGPTADRRPKPNVAAFGIVLTTTPGGSYERVEGTSFASPLVAGFAACAWQQRRELTAMQLFRQLQESAELYPYFDYAHGYGHPRADYFINDKADTKTIVPAFDFVAHDSLVAVIIRAEAAIQPAQTLPFLVDQPDATVAVLLNSNPEKMTEAIPKAASVGHEKPVPSAIPLAPEINFAPYLYWEIADRRGVLRRYETRAVSQRLVVQVPRRLVRNGDTLRVHFKGYTGTYSE